MTVIAAPRDPIEQRIDREYRHRSAEERDLLGRSRKLVARLGPREAADQEACQIYRADVWLRSVAGLQFVPVWRILTGRACERVYDPEDELIARELELHLAEFCNRFWLTDRFGELVGIVPLLIAIDAELDRLSIGVRFEGRVILGSSG